MSEINLSFDELLNAIVQGGGGGGKREVEEAPDIEEKVRTIANTYDEFEHLRDKLERMRCFRVRGGSTPKWVARVVRGHEAFVKLAGMDVAMEVYAPTFDSYSEEEQEAILYHELMHVTAAETGELKVTRDHDVEEFISVIARFGPILPEHKRLVLALKPHAQKVQEIWNQSGEE